LVGQS
jgi:hypothetical protein